jgi:spoIIIJ-associated protein
VEWVETTGKTVDEAKDAALDQLGVDEVDAEFEIVAEEKTGLFGRVRREARVRARVRPAQPRAKADRKRGRDRRRPSTKKDGDKRATDKQDSTKKDGDKKAPATGSARGRSGAAGRSQSERAGRSGASNRRPAGSKSAGSAAAKTDSEERNVSEPVSLDKQGEVVEDFLDGLLEAFDVDGDITVERVDDEAIEVRVQGDNLGLLIGPRGNTLQAIQELARSAVQRQCDGPLEGRLRLDIAGYRARRREALERFAQGLAAEVLADGNERALEPMIAPDRKVIHDTVNEIDGVKTISEGEDPNRRVVIIPSA